LGAQSEENRQISDGEADSAGNSESGEQGIRSSGSGTGTAQQLNSRQRRAEKIANVPNELLESEHGRWLDTVATSESSVAFSALVAIEAYRRAQNAGRKSLASRNVFKGARRAKLRADFATILGMMRELETEANC
jgi:hypothetical protein